MAINGTKSAYPAMQPADAFLRDLESCCARWWRRREVSAEAASETLQKTVAGRLQENIARTCRKQNRPQIRRSKMSTMTINAAVAPLARRPRRHAIDVG
jgi:hypothetical protein